MIQNTKANNNANPLCSRFYIQYNGLLQQKPTPYNRYNLNLLGFHTENKDLICDLLWRNREQVGGRQVSH